jgi:hypothetical protein
VNIYDAIVRIMAEALALSNAVMAHWVSMPANATGPLDPNITLTATGTDLAQYLASAAVHTSDIVCVVVGALFPV